MTSDILLLSLIDVPLTQSVGISIGNHLIVNRHVKHGLKIGQGDNGQFSTTQSLGSHREAIVKDNHHAQHDTARVTHGVEAFHAVVARGQLVLDEDNLLSRLDIALNEVLKAMILGRGADIYKGMANESATNAP